MDPFEFKNLQGINLLVNGDYRLSVPNDISKFYIDNISTVPVETTVNKGELLLEQKPSFSVFLYDPTNVVHWALRFELLKNCGLLPDILEYDSNESPESIRKTYQRLLETNHPQYSLKLFMDSKKKLLEDKNRYIICIASTYSHLTKDKSVQNPNNKQELHAIIDFTAPNNYNSSATAVVTINFIHIRKRKDKIVDDKYYQHAFLPGYSDYIPLPTNQEQYDMHSVAYNISFKFLIIFFYLMLKQCIFKNTPIFKDSSSVPLEGYRSSNPSLSTFQLINNSNDKNLKISVKAKHGDIFRNTLNWFKLNCLSLVDKLRKINLIPVSWKNVQNYSSITNPHYIIELDNYDPHEIVEVLASFREFSGKYFKKLILKSYVWTSDMIRSTDGYFSYKSTKIGKETLTSFLVIDQNNLLPETIESIFAGMTLEITKFVNMIEQPFEMYNSVGEYMSVLFYLHFSMFSIINKQTPNTGVFLTNNVVGFTSKLAKTSMNEMDLMLNNLPSVKVRDSFDMVSPVDICNEFITNLVNFKFNLNWHKNGKKCTSNFVILLGIGNYYPKNPNLSEMPTDINKLLETFMITAKNEAKKSKENGVETKYLYFGLDDLKTSYHLSVYDIEEEKIVSIAIFDFYEFSRQISTISSYIALDASGEGPFYSTQKLMYLSNLYTLSEYSIAGMSEIENNDVRNYTYKIDMTKKGDYSVSLASLLTYCVLRIGIDISKNILPIIGFGVVAASPRTKKILERIKIPKTIIYIKDQDRGLYSDLEDTNASLYQFYEKYLPSSLINEYKYISNMLFNSEKLERLAIFRKKVDMFVGSLKAHSTDAFKNELEYDYRELIVKYYETVVKRFEYLYLIRKLKYWEYAIGGDFHFLNFMNKMAMKKSLTEMDKIEKEFKDNCGFVYQSLTVDKRPLETNRESNKRIKVGE